MADIYKVRRTILSAMVLVGVFCFIFFGMSTSYEPTTKTDSKSILGSTNSENALKALANIVIKGRAPKTGYDRSQFGASWSSKSGCDTRNIILNRDLTSVSLDSSCNVISGTLNDPYTGKVILLKRGSGSSSTVQIDHVVALSDAWQKGAQQFTKDKRIELANDPLELLAVDGGANLEKSDGDAATWLPPNKSFRCQYVARQIAVKIKYGLWMTRAEYDIINSILSKCPNQLLPSA